eukprot:Gb_01853 [translate_table: standard]
MVLNNTRCGRGGFPTIPFGGQKGSPPTKSTYKRTQPHKDESILNVINADGSCFLLLSLIGIKPAVGGDLGLAVCRGGKGLYQLGRQRLWHIAWALLCLVYFMVVVAGFASVPGSSAGWFLLFSFCGLELASWVACPSHGGWHWWDCLFLLWLPLLVGQAVNVIDGHAMARAQCGGRAMVRLVCFAMCQPYALGGCVGLCCSEVHGQAMQLPTVRVLSRCCLCPLPAWCPRHFKFCALAPCVVAKI